MGLLFTTIIEENEISIKATFHGHYRFPILGANVIPTRVISLLLRKNSNFCHPNDV